MEQNDPSNIVEDSEAKEEEAVVEEETVVEDTQEAKTENTGLSMADLLEMEDLNLDMPTQGEVRTGTIASISSNES